MPDPLDPSKLAELRELATSSKDYMVADGDDLLWLIEQSIQWPTRVHPERTTNNRFLHTSMAATSLALLAEIDRLNALLKEKGL